ncbi:uncharacterized protein [Antedon mediterranea]|uniref:uncharacterized protein isoform X2 n=1 Tax=Antedon mediterranea TaxID=105859 RepID=UPI003AF530C1
MSIQVADMAKLDLNIRGSQVGMAGFEQHLKQLKESQLMKSSEFIDMFKTAEKFHHDMKLSYLTCRNKSSLNQQAEDSQFYNILLNMMREIASINGIKQREEVKKLYRWFKTNQGVLNSSSHFNSSKQGVYKQPLLNFSDDAIKFYSVPLDKRNKSGNKVTFLDNGRASRQSSTKGSLLESNKRITKKPEGANRPYTAPAQRLHRPKIGNNLSSSSSNPQVFDSPSLTAQNVSTHQPKQYSYNRPATAIGIMSHNASSVDETIACTSSLPSTDNGVSKPISDNKCTDCVEDDAIAQEENNQFPMPHLVNPVAQHQFVENHDDCLPSNKVVSIHVVVPDNGSPQTVREQETPLEKWTQYHNAQIYGEDIIGTHQLFGRSGSPAGIRYTAHDGGENPELYTRQVISNYALENESSTVDCGKQEALVYQSLEDFYKSIEEYKPGKTKSTSHSKSAKHIRGHTSDDIEDGISKRELPGNGKYTKVHFESIVKLSGDIGEKMSNSKEKLSPDPKAGFRKPSVTINGRPHTAPPQSGRIKLYNSSPVPPPNSYRPASTCSQSSIDYTPRNKRGEPIIMLPEKSEYTVHMRPDERNHAVAPVCNGNLAPEMQHYRWQNTGLGNVTCYNSVGSCETSLRSAGGSWSVRRPKTPDTSMKTSPRSAGGPWSIRRSKTPEASIKKKWNTAKPSDHNQRVPQAASHVTTMIHPQTIASMVVVNHLGTGKRRLRSRMGNINGMFLDDEVSDIAGSMEFVPIINPAPIQGRAQNNTGRENHDVDQNDNSENGEGGDSVIDDIDSSRISTAPSLTSEIGHLDETNELDYHINGEHASPADKVVETEKQYSVSVNTPSQLTEGIYCKNMSETDSKNIREQFLENLCHQEDLFVVNDGLREEKDETSSYWSTNEVEGTSSYWSTNEVEGTSSYWSTNEVEGTSSYWSTNEVEENGHSKLQQSVGSQLFYMEEPKLPSRTLTCGQKREVKLQTDHDKSEMRFHGEGFIPSGLTDEHRTALMTHPTGVAKSMLKFDVMMPHVQKMPLTPRKSSQTTSPVSNNSSSHQYLPTSSGKSSLHSSPNSNENVCCQSLLMQVPSPEQTSRVVSSSPSGFDHLYLEEYSTKKQQFKLKDNQKMPPQILIKRPSSAPVFNNSEPDAMNMFRPVSPDNQSTRGRRLNSPHLAVSSPVAVRPTSARAKLRGKEWNGRPLPIFGASKVRDDLAVQRSKQARESVNIRHLFSNKASRQYLKEKERHERLKWEKMQRKNEDDFRINQEELWNRNLALMNRGDIAYRNWEKEYMADKAQREKMRLQKMNVLLHKQALQNRKALAYLKRIGPHVDVWELFHGEKRGISKVQMKCAAITLQKYLRGMIVRRKFEAVRLKSQVHASTFKKFLDYYCAMMKRIARRYLVNKPRIHFDLWQLDDFMERKRHYEYVFAKQAHPGDELEVKDLEVYFKECDHYPSITEMHDAIKHVTKKDAQKPGLKLKEAEVVEISFQIYVPPGCGLTTDKTRKSTWLNPLVKGVEARRLMGKITNRRLHFYLNNILTFYWLRSCNGIVLYIHSIPTVVTPK